MFKDFFRCRTQKHPGGGNKATLVPRQFSEITAYKGDKFFRVEQYWVSNDFNEGNDSPLGDLAIIKVIETRNPINRFLHNINFSYLLKSTRSQFACLKWTYLDSKKLILWDSELFKVNYISKTFHKIGVYNAPTALKYPIFFHKYLQKKVMVIWWYFCLFF